MRFYYIIFSLLFTFVFRSVQSQTRITNFGVVQYKNSIQLSFIITPGEYCTGYDVLRSSDGTNFQNIYNYPSVCGDIIKPKQMVYYDESPQKNIKSYYQVFVPPNNYSEVLSITYYEISKLGYVLLSNPTTDFLKIYINSSFAKLELYDLTGNKVSEFITDKEGWINQNISSMNSGMYVFVVTTTDERKLSGKIIKQ
jgi:hypothetical protein